MQSADAATPAPTYGTPASSSSPCTVPSSPNGPCRIGSTTSTAPSARAGAESASTGRRLGDGPDTLSPARPVLARGRAPSGRPRGRSRPSSPRSGRDRAPRATPARTRARSRARSSARPRSGRRAACRLTASSSSVRVGGGSIGSSSSARRDEPADDERDHLARLELGAARRILRDDEAVERRILGVLAHDPRPEAATFQSAPRLTPRPGSSRRARSRSAAPRRPAASPSSPSRPASRRPGTWPTTMPAGSSDSTSSRATREADALERRLGRRVRLADHIRHRRPASAPWRR